MRYGMIAGNGRFPLLALEAARRLGHDVTVIACGVAVLQAMAAAEQAAANGVSVRVLDMHTVKPIDETAVMQAILDTRRIITAEDHTVVGGLGSAVADVIAKSGKGCAFRKLGYQDEYSIVGYPEDLQHKYKIDADGILETIGDVVRAEFEQDENWEDED